MRTIGYTRVSTEEQTQGDYTSLDAQRQRIENFGLSMETPVDYVLCDPGYSGKSLDRPQIQSLLRDVEAGLVSTVIVVKLDRLSRSVRDLQDLVDLFQRKNVKLVSVSEAIDTTTATGRMFVTFLSMFAQFERETIVERTTVGLSARRRQRRAYGPTPYGYRREDHQLIQDPDQQVVLQSAKDWRREGWTWEQIAEAFTNAGIPAPRGPGKWYSSSVRAILNSKMTKQDEGATA